MLPKYFRYLPFEKGEDIFNGLEVAGVGRGEDYTEVVLEEDVLHLHKNSPSNACRSNGNPKKEELLPVYPKIVHIHYGPARRT